MKYTMTATFDGYWYLQGEKHYFKAGKSFEIDEGASIFVDDE